MASLQNTVTATNMLRSVSTLNVAYLSARVLTTFPSLSPSVPSFSKTVISKCVDQFVSRHIDEGVEKCVDLCYPLRDSQHFAIVSSCVPALTSASMAANVSTSA